VNAPEARERTQLRPTVFGMVVALVLVVAAALRPPVADPSVTGLVWAGLAGAVALGVIWPVINVRMIGVRAVAAPADLVVGQLATVELELTGRASGLSIGATGSGAAVIDVVSPGVIRIPLTIAHRGAYQRIRVDVGSDAPFGVLFANRTRLVDLPRQLLVGPEPVAHPAVPGELPGDLQEPMPSGHGSTGEAVRSVRPYVVGDPSHLVHWPSTARTGSLVVRELEPPSAKGLAIVVDLRPPGAVADPASAAPASSASSSTSAAPDPQAMDLAVETTAGRAAGAAASAMERGARVVLCTVEASGPVVAEVADALGVSRRLALAVSADPPAAPEGWPTLHLRADVHPAPTTGPIRSVGPAEGTVDPVTEPAVGPTAVGNPS